jgi:hypothetical protein
MKNKHSSVDPYTNGQHEGLPISACSKSLIIDSSFEEILQNDIFIENLILIISCKKKHFMVILKYRTDFKAIVAVQ